MALAGLNNAYGLSPSYDLFGERFKARVAGRYDGDGFTFRPTGCVPDKARKHSIFDIHLRPNIQYSIFHQSIAHNITPCQLTSSII